MLRKGHEALQLLRVLLVASIVVPALSFCLLAWFSYWEALRSTERELVWVSEVAREHAEKVFDSHRLVADRVIDLLQGRDDDAIRQSEAALHGQARTIIANLPQAQSFVVLNREGRLLVATDQFPVSRTTDFSDRDYFRALKDGSLPSYISQVQQSRVDGKVFFGWGRPRIGRDGAFDGLIDIAISPSFFMKFYKTLIERDGTARDGRVVTMIRDDGQILVRYPPFDGPTVVPKKNRFFDAVRRNPDGGVYTNSSVIDAGAPTRLFAFNRVPGHPIYIVAGRSVEAINAAWRWSMLGYLAAGVPCTAALYLTTLAALGRTRREQEALALLRDEMEGRRQAEEQLRQSQKMEAVGQLTGGIAHDFNNLLTGIMGSLELMQRRISLGRTADVSRYIDAAMTSAERAAALTHRLLAFSRRQPLDPKPVDPNRLIGAIEELLRRTIGEAIHLDIVLALDVWPTLCDPHQLENALLNLVINARDAMPAGGSLTIGTSNVRRAEADAEQNPDVVAGQFVRISVSDTGAGMPADVVERAFEPFFTTKPLGQGTGLGLSMIYGFARQSEGQIAISSAVGEGTTVQLDLPRFRGRVDEAKPQRPVASVERSRRGETVLVVEDEPAVRDLVIDVLGNLGYRVLQASDGPSGLAVLRSAVTIDLLVTDVGLPGINGRQLADLGRLARSDLKVLFITGYAENATFGSGGFDPDMQMMTKPFAVEALAARITEMLAADPSPANVAARERT